MFTGIEYESSTLVTVNGTNYTIVPQYSTYSAWWIAFMLEMAALFGIIHTANYFKPEEDDDE